MSKHEYAGELPFWYDGKSVNEVGFCEEFLQQHPMVCVGGSFFTKDAPLFCPADKGQATQRQRNRWQQEKTDMVAG